MQRIAKLALAVPLAVGLAPLATTTAAAASTNPAHSGHCVTGALKVKAPDPEADPNPEGGSSPVTETPVRRASWTLYSGRTALASGSTNAASGVFRACALGHRSVTSIKFTANAINRWMVVDPASRNHSAFTFSVAAATGAKLGVVVAPQAQAYAWRLLDNLNLLWGTLHPRSGTINRQCWVSTEKRCDTITYTIDTDDVDDAYFDLGDSNGVVIGARSALSKHIAIHETGHVLMWLLYGKTFPDVTDCNPHYINKVSSTSCAWTEGFADTVANYVLHDRRFVWGDGYSYSYTTESTWDTGDATQGRVSQSLLDLYSYDGSWSRSLRELARYRPADFKAYYVQRPKSGLLDNAWTAHILRTHTISYRG